MNAHYSQPSTFNLDSSMPFPHEERRKVHQDGKDLQQEGWSDGHRPHGPRPDRGADEGLIDLQKAVDKMAEGGANAALSSETRASSFKSPEKNSPTSSGSQ